MSAMQICLLYRQPMLTETGGGLLGVYDDPARRNAK